MEYLQKLGERAGLGGWNSWSVAYRVLAIVAAALLAYWLLRVAVPAAVRLVRPVLLLLLAGSRHLGGLPQRDVLDGMGVQAAGALRALGWQRQYAVSADVKGFPTFQRGCSPVRGFM